MAQLVALSDYWWGWGNLLFRWLHVIAAMAWVGASFYFIALDKAWPSFEQLGQLVDAQLPR